MVMFCQIVGGGCPRERDQLSHAENAVLEECRVRGLQGYIARLRRTHSPSSVTP